MKGEVGGKSGGQQEWRGVIKGFRAVARFTFTFDGFMWHYVNEDSSSVPLGFDQRTSESQSRGPQATDLFQGFTSE